MSDGLYMYILFSSLAMASRVVDYVQIYIRRHATRDEA